jgi:predicted exporter
LVLLVFRASRPLLLNLLVIGVGILVAISSSLLIFRELHVAALLFGVSLIGIAVDYGLQYCTEVFAPGDANPKTRLKHVMPGITLGMATTVIGYLTLLFAPYPGLYQIATFSALGLVAAWVTVVLWLPYLDNSNKPKHGQKMLVLADKFSNFWRGGASKLRYFLLIMLFILTLIGLPRFHFDDDVRRMQSLDGPLVKQQNKIQQLIGNSGGTQFFLVHGQDIEMLLQHEEALAAKLKPMIGKSLAGFQAPAQYIPSAKRQAENWQLVTKLYTDELLQQSKALSLSKAPEAPGNFKVLHLEDVASLSFLSPLLLDKNTHVVMLDKITDLQAVKDAANGIEGVKLVDPAGDFSSLLAKYRNRTLVLMALSTLFMLPLIFWRYGFIGGLWVKLPAILAIIITPFIRALLGSGFTFFDAIALLLVLSMGVDYAIFCAETDNKRKPATIIGVVMSALTAMLSFGLLAFSNMLAVHNFGATMLVGITLSLIFAPIAQNRKSVKRKA